MCAVSLKNIHLIKHIIVYYLFTVIGTQGSDNIASATNVFIILNKVTFLDSITLVSALFY